MNLDLLHAPLGPLFECQLRSETEELKTIVASARLMATSLADITQKTKMLCDDYSSIDLRIKNIRADQKSRCFSSDSPNGLSANNNNDHLYSSLQSLSTSRLSTTVFATMDISLGALQVIASQQLQFVTELNGALQSFMKSLESQLHISVNNQHVYASQSKDHEQFLRTYLRQRREQTILNSSNNQIQSKLSSLNNKPTHQQQQLSPVSPPKISKSFSVSDLMSPATLISDDSVVGQLHALESMRCELATHYQLRCPMNVIDACEHVYKRVGNSLKQLCSQDDESGANMMGDLMALQCTVEDVRLNNIRKLEELEHASIANDEYHVKMAKYFAGKLDGPTEPAVEDKNASSSSNNVISSEDDALDLSHLKLAVEDPRVIKQGYAWMSVNQVDFRRVWLMLEPGSLYALIRPSSPSRMLPIGNNNNNNSGAITYDKFIISENLQLCGLQDQIQGGSNNNATGSGSTNNPANIFAIRIASDDVAILIQTEGRIDYKQWTQSIRSAIEHSYHAADFPSNGPYGNFVSTDESFSGGGSSGNTGYNSVTPGVGGDDGNNNTGNTNNAAAQLTSSSGNDERTTALVATILAKNTVCADCGRPHPDWASTSLCVVICIDCAGIHRALGTHISKVRSLSLDVLDYETCLLLSKSGRV
jgi:hypothetical protein